ncbi:uncharacterized protein LOC111086738 [Limulus polyphemus]|uniref:Uncharacterized protein LOC111086738 n=1 Tax=Limulus polyphemus TaxID=6850 RepID=A0ABM1SSA6_LIMPO|nr:uncharacterized protein LOC111086738 [Limulus polyphemus]
MKLIIMCSLLVWEHAVLGVEDLNKRPDTPSDSFGSTSSSDYGRYPYDSYGDRDTKNSTYDDSNSGKYNNPYNNNYDYEGGYGDRFDYRDRYNPSYHSRYDPGSRNYGEGYAYYLNEPRYPPYWNNPNYHRNDWSRYNPPHHSRYRPNNDYGNDFPLYLNEPRPRFPPHRYYNNYQRNYPYLPIYDYPNDYRIYYNLGTGEFRVSDENRYFMRRHPDFPPPGIHRSRYGTLRNNLAYEPHFPPRYHGYGNYGPGYRRSYSKEETSVKVLTGNE